MTRQYEGELAGNLRVLKSKRKPVGLPSFVRTGMSVGDEFLVTAWANTYFLFDGKAWRQDSTVQGGLVRAEKSVRQILAEVELNNTTVFHRYQVGAAKWHQLAFKRKRRWR